MTSLTLGHKACLRRLQRLTQTSVLQAAQAAFAAQPLGAALTASLFRVACQSICQPVDLGEAADDTTQAGSIRLGQQPRAGEAAP